MGDCLPGKTSSSPRGIIGGEVLLPLGGLVFRTECVDLEVHSSPV